MDIQGQLFATLAIIGLIFGVIQGGAQGWSAPSALLGHILGLIALALFIHRELTAPNPLMDLRIFRNAGFSAACFAAMMALFSIVGVGFMLALFLGSAKQLTPLGIAIHLVFIPGTAFIVAPLAGKALARLPAHLSLLLGLLLAALGTFLIAHTDEHTTYLDVVWRLMLFGVSIAVMLASVATVAINSVPLRQAGMAGATNTVIRQIGGTLGPAVTGSIYATRIAHGASPAEAFTTALSLTTVLLLTAMALVLAAALSRR